MIPRIALTAGEPAGIGPDLTIQLAQQAWPAELVVFADPELLQARAKQLALPLTLRPYTPEQAAQPQAAGSLTVAPITLQAPVIAGQLNTANSPYVLASLTAAAKAVLSHHVQALVTGPVHKGVINDAGFSFQGHTEFFAEQANCQQVVMMLASEQLRVALVTTHLPLAAVSKAITRQRLVSVIHILHRELQQKFGLAQPRILVCGLNPHAGEGGHLGFEEIDTISPTLEVLRQEYGYHLVGPLPADTIFQPHYLNEADVVLAMYHDQGLPVLKYQGFGQAVNITLGLPFIRTSVDHGTALDLAGTGQANSSSFKHALSQALTMVQNKPNE